jgi:hypothetical protein
MALTLLEMQTEFPDPFRQWVVSLLREASQIMPLLNFIPWSGFSYPYPTKSKLPGIGFRSLNSQFSETQSILNPAVETLSIFGGRVKTDTVMDVVKPGGRPGNIQDQVEAAAKFWDKNFINGDPAVTDNAFLGLKPRIGGNQLITPTASANGSPVTMDDVIRLQDQVEGPNNTKLLLMNQTARRLLSHDVGKNAGGKRIFEDGGMQEAGAQVGIPGSPWQLFNGSRVTEVWYDEAEAPILPFTEVCGSSGATCSSIYCIRPGNNVDERYVQGISGLPGHFMKVGPINFGEYLLDVIQGLFGIGIFSGYGAARLQGINQTPT